MIEINKVVHSKNYNLFALFVDKNIKNNDYDKDKLLMNIYKEIDNVLLYNNNNKKNKL